jgi:hypothetical protein
VQKIALVETQQRQWKKPHPSFIYNGKQGGGVPILGEGHEIETRETCIPTSLNINK